MEAVSWLYEGAYPPHWSYGLYLASLAAAACLFAWVFTKWCSV